MHRKAFTLSISIAVAALAAAAFAFLPATASAAPGRTAWDATEIALRAGGAPRSYSLSCVTSAQMNRENGGLPTGGTIMGLTFPYQRRVLILDRLCAEVGKWYWTAEENLTYGTVAALQTVMHEAQHARGVRTEWVTECRAIGPTLTYLSHNDTDAYQMKLAREYLYHGMEKYRPAEYKLRGRC